MIKENSDTKDTVFVHSGFRTSSTWFWLKLRKIKNIRAYYEPFNEGLATISKLEASGLGPSSWNSHHPTAEAYFLEFLDLIDEKGGIEKFRTEMSFQNHIPLEGVDGDLCSFETGYLSMLIDRAHEAGRRPALCDTRSLGRSRAINKKFGGTHVLLTRNLHEQWCSFAEQAAHGNNYFLDSIFRQIEAGKHDPFLGRLAKISERNDGRTETFEQYVLFLLSQLYLNAVAFDICQVKIDATRISNCTATRIDAEESLSKIFNSQIDLKDVSTHVSFSSLEAKSRHSAEKLARQILSDMTIPNASSECKTFVQSAFSDAFKCWDQSIYYGEASKNFLRKKINSEQEIAADVSTRLNALSSQLHAELASTKQELASAEQGLAEIKQELSGAKQEVSRLLDVIQRRPRPLWEMLIFRRSGRPKKVFRRILFHKSGKPRRVFSKWILLPDGRPRAVFKLWMSSPEYQNLRAAVRVSAVSRNAQVPLSPDAQQLARRVTAIRARVSKI